jgi:hypothetical protein
VAGYTLYQALIEYLSPTLERAEFLPTKWFRADKAFIRRQPEAWAVIHIQRSRYSTADLLRCTASVGSSLDAIRRFNGVPNKPQFGDLQWHIRIGHLLPVHEDKWWELRAGSLEADAATLLDALVSVAIPQAIERCDPPRMIETWKRGRSQPFEEEYQRYRWLAILLRDAGRIAELVDTVRNLAVAAEAVGMRAYLDDDLRRLGLEHDALPH